MLGLKVPKPPTFQPTMPTSPPSPHICHYLNIIPPFHSLPTKLDSFPSLVTASALLAAIILRNFPSNIAQLSPSQHYTPYGHWQ